LRVVNADGARSRPSATTIAVQRGAATGGPLDVRVVGRRIYLDAVRPARVDLLARRPLNVTVGLVRVTDGALVMEWPLGHLPVGAARDVTWDGRIGGAPQPAGRYEFRVYSRTDGGQAAQAGTPVATGAFDLVDHKFPIRGPHGFGEFAASFGGGRGHEGQDVFADCGTPLVAARGGVVKHNAFQSRAGNYIVIDGEATQTDYAYMHMRDRSPLTKGTRVRTGQVIGHVGDTGRADGCHLHFEMWSGPGWYTGGTAIDPLPFLKAWDAYS
ncbi:MAG: peptidoglycan DD-metalloendopeptidase family protein, partial [Solirubrobacterales bacterium]|nr:peptidoglycan DD-metalloendopeptidase family protein [Solirubrobacterales bacterium]